MDTQELLSTFGWRGAWLLNDLQAIANAIPYLEPEDLHTLNSGNTEAHGSKFVIAPGTGLGVGYLTWAGGHYQAYATEGGHADFAPANAQQEKLLAFLRKNHPQVQVEYVCSGIGMPNLYDFFKASEGIEAPEWLENEMAGAEDKTPVIVGNALAEKPGSEICQKALSLFVDILASVTGSLALVYGATGGVYVGGGIPPRILATLKRYNFVGKFVAKTGFEAYLKTFPVQVITNTETGLLGAAAYGAQRLEAVN